MKPVFVICEGVHDIALMGPLLERLGCEHFTQPLEKYPPVIKNLLIQRYQKRPLNEIRSRSEDQPARDLVPVFSRAYSYGNTLILFFVAKGDGADNEINELVSVLVDQSSENTPKDTRMSPFGLLFARDADAHGVKARVEEIVNAFSKSLAPCMPSFPGLEHGKVKREGHYSFGCWIFATPGHEHGALEDALASELKNHFGARWQEAEFFYDKHCIKGTHPQSKRLKAVISISGQPDHPSCSQAVVLREVLQDNNLLNRLRDAEWVKAFELMLAGIIAP